MADEDIPFSAYWGLAWSVRLIIVEFYLSLWPLGGQPTAKGFFSSYSSVVVFLGILFISKLTYFRGRIWVNTEKIDHDDGRRFYSEAQHDDARAGTMKQKLKNWLQRLQYSLKLIPIDRT